MGKITEVYYEEIDPTICSIEEASDFYYYYNLIGLREPFQSDYEKYEESQIKTKHRVIAEAISRGEVIHPKMNNSIFGVSVLKNSTVLIAEY